MPGLYSLAALLPAVLAVPYGPGQGGPGYGGGYGSPGYPHGPPGWPYGPGSGGHQPPNGYGGQKAIYLLDNSNVTENRIISFPVESNGGLGEAILTGTGGTGGYFVSTLATPAAIFFSQGSVATGGNYLFSVNSGSNTLSMFSINPQNPAQLTLVKTVDTQGEFPSSVAYSDSLSTACVVNVAGEGSVVCFQVSSDDLTPIGSPRPLDPAYGQTDPPTGPSNTVTEVVFDPQSTALWVVVKGSPVAPAHPGYFIYYPVTNGEVAAQGTAFQLQNVILNFGTSFVSNDSFLVAAPLAGGGVIATFANGNLSETYTLNVTGEAAICWSAYNPSLNQGLLLDAGRTTVEIVDPATGQLQTPIIAHLPGNNGTQGGLFDTAVLDNFSYSIADPGGVVVLDLQKLEQVEYTSLEQFGSRINFEGLAVWPDSYSASGWGGW